MNAPVRTLYVFFLLVCAAWFPASAQDNTAAAPSTSIWGSAYVMTGSSRMDDRPMALLDYRTLMPDSRLLQADLGSYRRDQGWFLSSDMQATSVVMGLYPFRGENWEGPELRVGFQTARGTVGDLTYSRTLRFPIDTLSSPSTGVFFVVDSLEYSRYAMSHQYQRAGLDVSMILRTRGRSRWSLYGGAGLGVGMRFNTRTAVEYTVDRSVNYPGGSLAQNTGTSEEEYVRNRSAAWMSLVVPLGLSFRLGRHDRFLSMFDLFIEGRTGTLFQGSSELGGITSIGTQFLFGLRVRTF